MFFYKDQNIKKHVDSLILRRMRLPFRLGSTSYLWPDDYVPNVERIAPFVDDIELLFFDIGENGDYLPSAETIAKLADLARINSISYTVHLPLDLNFVENEISANKSLDKVRLVIEKTQLLNPYAYIVHLNSKKTPKSTNYQLAINSLNKMADLTNDPCKICVENITNDDTEFLMEILRHSMVSRCLDIGHLWLFKRNPLEELRIWLERTRVIHIHGVDWLNNIDRGADHQSLCVVPPFILDPIIKFLVDNYKQIVTIELFDIEKFASSMICLRESISRTNSWNY